MISQFVCLSLLVHLRIVISVCVTEVINTSVNYSPNGDFETPYLGPNSWRFTTQPLNGWISAKSEQGTGSIYNSAWGSSTQVIELDTDANENYSQNLTLVAGSFSIKLSHAARQSGALTTSGMIIKWNGAVLLNLQASVDKNIHTISYTVTAVAGVNVLEIIGAGKSDGIGMTVDNILLNKMDSTQRSMVGGQCVCAAGYFDDKVNTACQPCTSQMVGCSSCGLAPISNTFYCTTCIPGYYKTLMSPCTLCSSRVSGCLTCSISFSGFTCNSCDLANGYFVDPANSSQCISCPVANCLTCATVSTCSVCNQTANYYLNNSTLQCDPCTIHGCSSCDVTQTVCFLCDATGNFTLFGVVCICDPGYFDDGVNKNCQTCVSRDANCLTCDYGVSNGGPGCLTCADGYFVLLGVCKPCSSVSTGCLNCSTDGQDCLTCDQANKYFLDDYMNPSLSSSTNYCILCNLNQCILCSSPQNCSLCNVLDNFFLNLTTSTCEICKNTGCQICSSLYQCAICNNSLGYYFSDPNATQCMFCNSSLNYFPTALDYCQLCTPANCTICTNLTACSVCDTTFYLNISTQLCDPCTMPGCIDCRSDINCSVCNSSAGYILDSSFQCQIPAPTPSPSPSINNNTSLDNCLRCSCEANVNITSSNVPSIHYSESECSTKKSLDTLALSVGITSYAIMIVSLASVKIVGLELFGVLQLAYFNLADNDYVNLYLSPFLDWRYLNGYNLDLKTGKLVPNNVKAIGYNAEFIANINIMFLILVGQLMVSTILFLLSSKIPVLSTVNRFLFQQVFLTIFLFNSFNIAFSAGLHFKYATPDNSQYYEISTLAAVLGLAMYVGVLVMLQTASQNGFGEFKQKFKDTFVCRLYVFISVLYRMGLGLYMAIGNDSMTSTLFMVGISLGYILFNIVNLPFSDFYQNYRANLCHVTQLAVLMVTNYYRSMKANDRLESKARIFTPAKIQIALILGCVAVSAVCLAYEIYLAIKNRLTMNKINTNSKNTECNQQNSLANLNNGQLTMFSEN